MDTMERYENIRANAHRFLESSPAGDSFRDYYKDSYRPGALDAKTKRLMALCGGLIAGCTGCIVGQANMAVEEGATVEEIMETCAVAMSLGGTLAWSQISKVMDFLTTKGMLD